MKSFAAAVSAVLATGPITLASAQDAPASLPAEAPILPAYQLVDLELYYALPHDTELTSNVTNLMGERYYESGSTQSNYINIQPGVPRTVALTLRTAF